jgi:hypothetical protein
MNNIIQGALQMILFVKTFKECFDQVKISGFQFNEIYDVLNDEWYLEKMKMLYFLKWMVLTDEVSEILSNQFKHYS